MYARIIGCGVSTRTYPTKESKRAKSPSRNVSEQYQNSIRQHPKTTGKQGQTQKATKKTGPTHDPENIEEGSKTNSYPHGSENERVENGIKSPKYRHNRLHLSTGSRRRVDDALKRIVRLSAPHAPDLYPEPPADHSTPYIKITEPARRTLPRNNDAQHTINILSKYNYPGLTILLQLNPPANTDHVVSAEDI